MPWVDEVMILDAPAQFFLHGKWEGTAYWGTPSLYVPLYGIIQVLWYKLFGFSFYSGRLLNILLFFCTGFLLILFAKKITKQTPSKYAIIIYSLFLWFLADLAALYRDGRPDILCALISTIINIKGYDYIMYEDEKPYWIIVFGCFLFMSGLQACVFILATGVYLLFSYWSKRMRTIRAILFFLLGCCIGLILTSVFMKITGVFNAFVINTLHESTTLWKLFLLVVPLFSAKNYGNLENVDIKFTEKLSESIDNSFFLVLMSGLLFIVIFNRLFKQKKFLLFSLFPLYVLIIMNLAGRYYSHYNWMIFIPMLFCYLIFDYLYVRKVVKIVPLVVLVFVLFGSISSFGKVDDCGYKEMTNFIYRQSFVKTDRIALPNACFYEIKPVVENCFFPEICPVDKIHRLDYLVMPIHEDKSDKLMNYYSNASGMNVLYKKLLQDKSIQVIPVDTCQYPFLIVYKIKRL